MLLSANLIWKKGTKDTFDISININFYWTFLARIFGSVHQFRIRKAVDSLKSGKLLLFFFSLQSVVDTCSRGYTSPKEGGIR